MGGHPISPLPRSASRINLQTYAADIQFSTLVVGIDNIHYDVFLSPRFVEFTRKYLASLLRQTPNVAALYGLEAKSFRPPETSAFRKLLGELLQASLTRAKFEKNIELDILLRMAILKFLTQEIGTQFSNVLLECKERIRARGEYFERTEEAQVMRARLAELQAARRNLHRQAGQHLYQVLTELDEKVLSNSRRALFGNDFREPYEMLKNRLLFVEAGKDDYLFLEHYVLLGTFVRDHDRMETFDRLLVELLRDCVNVGDQGEEASRALKTYHELAERALQTRTELAHLAEQRETLTRELSGSTGLVSRLRSRRDPGEVRAALLDIERREKFLQEKLAEVDSQLEAAKRRAEILSEEYHSKLGEFLNRPENARRLFDPKWSGEDAAATADLRAWLLEEWIERLEQRDLLVHVLASYEVRNLHLDYCPPLHLQQLRKGLVSREDLKRVEEILRQFPTRGYSLKRIEEASKGLRRYSRDEIRAVAIRFAEDFMRLRRELRNFDRLTALLERINLIWAERTRELSHLNNSLYEFLLPEEFRPTEDRVVSHAVIKTDIRGSTRITQELLARGLNPASHFSLSLHEPVKRILERYGAAKVFIEGDAIILAIYETESNRTSQRAVAKACLLGREILTVSQIYNARVKSSELPRLELGVGIAFQNSPPTFWMDSDSRIMISRALNLSDRLSSCSKAARRLLTENSSPFNLFLFQTLVEGAAEDELEEFLIRYNMNGIELNEEGFAKLGEEISLAPVETDFPMPWGRERVTLYVGEVPSGEATEKLVIRKGVVRNLLPGGKIGEPGKHAYYEVCTSPKVLELAEALLRSAAGLPAVPCLRQAGGQG